VKGLLWLLRLSLKFNEVQEGYFCVVRLAALDTCGDAQERDIRFEIGMGIGANRRSNYMYPPTSEALSSVGECVTA
jgi:hypothetical protein